MAEDTNKEIPSVRFVEKKVDTSWKDEIRKEREAAAKGEAPAPAPASAEAPAQPSGKTPGGKAEAKKPAEGQAKGGAQPSKLFMGFLAQMVQQGLMLMGAVENPYTGQREVDLEGAQQTIELLSVIQEKTKGNLAEQESRMLNEALREMQLHYVEVAQAVRAQMQKQAQNPQGQRPGGDRR
jgi:hypothetical protein